MKPIFAIAALAAGLAGSAGAASWTVSTDDSRVVFGSIKAGSAGESHHFPGVSGRVGEDGTARIEIDVTSVDTGIEIRDERMQTHVFKPEQFPKATVSGKVDLDALSGLAPGQTATTASELTLGFLGREIPVTAHFFVAPLGPDRVLVTTEDLIMLGTAELGIEQGVDALREIAGLASIARVSPIAVRLVLDRD